MKNYDVVVMGAGPGGYVAAIRAAQLGFKACVVEASHLGGICLNWGCIPTKSLLKSAEVLNTIKHAKDFGINLSGDAKPDIKAIVAKSRSDSAKLSKGIEMLLKKNKVDVILGYGKLAKNKVIDIYKDDKKTESIQAKNIIIATGARPKVIPGFEPDGKIVLTYKEAMIPDSIPSSILVVGSGAIGVEFASFYNDMGSKVTILEVADRILINEDKEIADIAKKSFEKQGIAIHTGAGLKKFTKSAKDVTVDFEVAGKAYKEKFNKVIMAVGISANSENIGLENTKIKQEKGFIITDKYQQTDEPGIYAIGDVTDAPWLAHVASHKAMIAAEKIAGKNPHSINKNNIPGCTYSHPQIASVGLTEEKAKAAGHDIKVGRFPFIGNGKAVTMGESEGLVKTIFDAKTGELLGAHLIGAEVTELIQGYVIGKTMECTEEDLMNTIFPHPTLSEMMHESVLNAYMRAIHF